MDIEVEKNGVFALKGYKFASGNFVPPGKSVNTNNSDIKPI